MKVQAFSCKCYVNRTLFQATGEEENSVHPEMPFRVMGLIRVSLILGLLLLGVLTLGACGAGLEPAPDFRFSLYQGEEELGGRELSLSDLRGKPLVLNFWAGLCPPCRLEMPDLQEFYDQFGDRITLFGLDMGPFTGLGSNRQGRELLEELHITYPAGFTLDGQVIIEYEVLGMPSTFFITADGAIFRKWTGFLNKGKLIEITGDMLGHPGLAMGEPREPFAES